MSWTKKRDPQLPAEPAYHDPDRCMNCGHSKSQHDPEVGCLVEGGTKYIEDENGNGSRVCSCEEYVTSPEKAEMLAVAAAAAVTAAPSRAAGL